MLDRVGSRPVAQSVYPLPSPFVAASTEPKEAFLGRVSDAPQPGRGPLTAPKGKVETAPSTQPSAAAAPLASLGTGMLGEQMSLTSTGAIFTLDPELASYSQSIGLNVQSRDLSQTGTQSALAAATTLTPVGSLALTLAGQYLQPTEMLAGNSGFYHDAAHPLNVAGVTGELATAMGRSPQRVRFLQQVALLHDFDERLDAQNTPKYGTPARVQVTLAWMDKNQSALQSRMGWSADEFKEAEVLIARTDFPFDTKPRSYGTSYDGQSPQSLYRTLLEALPADRRASVMEEGVALSYADQVGNYVGTQEQAKDTVLGLSQEIHVPGPVLLKGTATFQKAVGADIEADRQIARDMGLNVHIPSAAELEGMLGTESRAHLLDNRAYFERLAAQES